MVSRQQLQAGPPPLPDLVVGLMLNQTKRKQSAIWCAVSCVGARLCDGLQVGWTGLDWVGLGWTGLVVVGLGWVGTEGGQDVEVVGGAGFKYFSQCAQASVDFDGLFIHFDSHQLWGDFMDELQAISCLSLVLMSKVN